MVLTKDATNVSKLDSSVCFDGSHYPIEENIEKDKRTCKSCNRKDIYQAEVGLSVEKKTGLSVGENVQIQKNVKQLQILE